MSILRTEEKRIDLLLSASPNFVPLDDNERDAYSKIKRLFELKKQETLTKEV